MYVLFYVYLEGLEMCKQCIEDGVGRRDSLMIV